MDRTMRLQTNWIQPTAAVLAGVTYLLNLVDIPIFTDGRLSERIRILDLAYALTALLVIAAILQRRDLQRKLHRYRFVWIVVGVLAAFALTDSVFNGWSIDIAIVLGSLFGFSVYVFLLLMVPSHLWIVIRVAVALTILIAATGVYATALLGQTIERSAVSWPFIDPNHTSALLFVSALVFLTIPTECGSPRSWLIAAYPIPALVLLDSNAALLAAFLVLCYLIVELAKMRTKGRVQPRIVITVVFLVCYLAFAVISRLLALEPMGNQQGALQEESTAVTALEDSAGVTVLALAGDELRISNSINSRRDLLERALILWNEKPMGRGLEDAVIQDFPFYSVSETQWQLAKYEIHNELVTWLVAYGIPGLMVIALSLLFAIIWGGDPSKSCFCYLGCLLTCPQFLLLAVPLDGHGSRTSS